MTSAEASLASRLEALLGAEAVRPGDAPPTAPGRCPEIWVAPRDEEQVRELLSWATREKVPLYPRGGATRWRAAFRPFRRGIGLDMRHLDQLEELDPDNLTVVAGAGMSHGALQADLAAHRLFFPPETAWPESSTLGGEVAADASGPRKYAYGSARAYLLGARVLFPDGSGGWFGGKQVKNVSGYDVSRFLCGSWGSLGVITRVVIKVRPLPERGIVKVLTGAMAAVLRAAEEVRRQLYGSTAIEVLLGRAASWWCQEAGVVSVVAHAALAGPEDTAEALPELAGAEGPAEVLPEFARPGDAGVTLPAVLLVGLEGAREAVDRQCEWLEGLAARHGLALPDGWATSATLAREDGDAAAAIWEARRSLFDRAAGAGASVWNVAVPPADLGPLLENLHAIEGAAPGAGATLVAPEVRPKLDDPAGAAGGEPARGILGVAAHAGNGHAHLFLAGGRAPAGGVSRCVAGSEAGAVGDWRWPEAISAVVRARGGYLLTDDAAWSGSPYEVLPPVGGLGAVCSRLKGALDPGGIMCPAGRVGGEGA
ncbi:MAG: FAD-binding oxidoreductase [Bacillota bacterium]|nr:FAD-binding oxidoreductase [Bacillota bacterium]